MGFIYSIQICEISHQAFGPRHRKCLMCPMTLMSSACANRKCFHRDRHEFLAELSPVHEADNKAKIKQNKPVSIFHGIQCITSNNIVHTSQNMVSLSSGNNPLASSMRKSRRMNFLNPQSLPWTNRYARWLSERQEIQTFNSSPPGQNGRQFGRQHFQMHFHQWKVLYFNLNFTGVCS